MALNVGGPIDYSTNAAQPMAAYGQGLQTGAQQQQIQYQQQQEALQTNMQQMMAQDAAKVAQNPTPDAIAGLAVKYPAMAANFKNSFDMLNTTQQQAKLDQAVPIYAAVQAGHPEVAAQLLRNQGDAYDAAGRPQDAQSARIMAQLVTDHPEMAKTLMGVPLAATLGPDKFAQTFGTVGDQTRANQIQPAKVQQANAEATTAEANAGVAPVIAKANAVTAMSNANVAPQAAAANVAETQSKAAVNFNKVGELPPENLKIVNDGATAAATAADQAQRYSTLADQIDAAKPPAGFVGTAGEFLKSLTGNQNAITELRQQYTQLRNTGIATALPGVSRMTDNDIKLATKGFPDDNANPAVMSSFLRGAAKLQQIQAARESIQSEWASKNGQKGLGPLRTDTVINGTLVPAGTTLNTYLPLYTSKIVGDMQNQQTQSAINSRSYMRFAQPTANSAPTAPVQQIPANDAVNRINSGFNLTNGAQKLIPGFGN